MSAGAINIVIVEDEPQIRRFVRAAPEAESWNVFEAETLQRGLVEAGTRKPDLVIPGCSPFSSRIPARCSRTGKSSAPYGAFAAKTGRRSGAARFLVTETGIGYRFSE